MKYLRIVFLFALALFCGSAAAHAQRGVDFHVGVVDPVCSITSPIFCNVTQPGVPFQTTFDNQTCVDHNTPAHPVPDGPNDGCFLLFNGTNDTFDSLSLTLANLGDATFDCPVSAIFSTIDCDPSGALLFSGAPGLGSTETLAVVIEVTPQGVQDGFSFDQLTATGVVDPTPEPDSLLLLSTGVMMAGLYMSKRPLLAAFGKK